MSKSPSLRRIQADIRELAIDPSDQYHAAPLESDMFEWHFTIRGAADTEFEGGVYHGRILLPHEYPFKPPHIVFLTPSGRFETQTKVCLSFSAHHPELWQPAWGIRLILEALISFLPTPADGAIGALDWTKEERKKLAKESVKFRCPLCCGDGMTCVDLLPKVKPSVKGGDDAGNGKAKKTRFQEEIEKLKMLQLQNHAVEEESGNEKGAEEENSCDPKSSDNLKGATVLPESSDNSSTKNEEQRKTDSEQKESIQQSGLEMKQDDSQNISQSDTFNEKPTDPKQINRIGWKTGDDMGHRREMTGKIAQLVKETLSNISEQQIIELAEKHEKLLYEKSSSLEAYNSNAIFDELRVEFETKAEKQTAHPTPQTAVETPPHAPIAPVPAATDSAPLVSDNVLNGLIMTLSVIVFVLVRKAMSLVDELRSIGESLGDR